MVLLSAREVKGEGGRARGRGSQTGRQRVATNVPGSRSTGRSLGLSLSTNSTRGQHWEHDNEDWGESRRSKGTEQSRELKVKRNSRKKVAARLQAGSGWIARAVIVAVGWLSGCTRAEAEKNKSLLELS